jgi:DNA-directed RNA polymerase subunit RPC12/RpoP
LLDEEDLFCANCGTAVPQTGTAEASTTATAAGAAAKAPAAPAAHEVTRNFVCKGCGASMSYDASAGTLRCPFCGSTELEKQPDAKEIAPDWVVQFAVARETAVADMRRWLGGSIWRPGDLSEQAAVVAMTPVYVPFWVFEARTHTYWTADTSHPPVATRSGWYPVSGNHEGEHQGLLVGASGVLTAAETTAICPFDLSTAVTPDKVDLNNAIFERFTVPRKYARPLANQGFEAIEAQECQKYVPGRCRNLHVNVQLTDMTSQPVLLPVWIMAYRYQERVFRFLVNGQSGTATGQAPVSWRRVGVAIAIAVVVLLLLLLVLAGHLRSQEPPRRFGGEPARSLFVCSAGEWYTADRRM